MFLHFLDREDVSIPKRDLGLLQFGFAPYENENSVSIPKRDLGLLQFGKYAHWYSQLQFQSLRGI